MKNRSKTKWILAAMLIVSLAVLVAGCGGGSSPAPEHPAEEPGAPAGNGQPEYELSFASSAMPYHVDYVIAKEWGQRVEERSGGRVKFNYMFDAIMGGEKEELEGLQLGTIDLALTSDMTLPVLEPQLAFIHLPYLIEDDAMADKYFFNGWIGEEIKSRLLPSGIRVLSLRPNEFRDVATANKRVASVEDMKGVKIRTPESPALLEYWKPMGALPVAMSITEYMSSATTGVVDAFDGGIANVPAYGVDNVSKYYTVTHHCWSGGVLAISEKTWQKLPSDIQQIMMEEAEKYQADVIAAARQQAQAMTEELSNRGLEVVTLTPEEKEKFRQAAKPAWDAITQKLDPELVQKLMEDPGVPWER